ncbi:MAG: DUF1131 family protein [Phormidium sp. SL48-SHIP]|nr:MAG: DUF1131 family protein [Phormidium sp. SL48-SHIP]
MAAKLLPTQVSLMAVVLITGCATQTPTQTREDQPQESESARVSQVQDSVESSAPPLTNAGWGEIGVETPFDGDRIQALLPGYQVETGQISREGESYPTLDVYQGETRVAQLDPLDPNRPEAGIQRITITDRTITGPGGVRVGMTWAETPNLDQLDCFPGEGPTTGYLLCTPANAERVQYIYPQLGRDGDRAPAPLERLVWLNW